MMQTDKQQLFIQKVHDLFPKKAKSILKSMQSPPPATFRVNTIKTTPKEVEIELKKLGYSVKKGQIPYSYIAVGKIKNKPLSHTKLFEEGKIYIQGLSSMIPVILLNPKKDEKVLDLCAAPGSKTTQIAALTNNKAEIIAVDNNINRIYKLKGNLKRTNSKATLIHSHGPALPKKYPEYLSYFDKILVDAPCSNEGDIVLSKKDALKYWNPKLPKKISKLQKRLAFSAVAMLKPGGTLVYSTCTFSNEENIHVVNWLLKNFKELKLIKTKQTVPNGLYTGFFAAKLEKKAKQ